MKFEFSFVDVNGEENQVSFGMVKSDGEYRKYGIIAKQHNSQGKLVDIAKAGERYITGAETEAVMEMLCKCQVMPCTLCDII